MMFEWYIFGAQDCFLPNLRSAWTVLLLIVRSSGKEVLFSLEMSIKVWFARLDLFSLSMGLSEAWDLGWAILGVRFD